MNFNPLRIFKKHYPKASPELTTAVLKDYNKHRPLGPQDKICLAPFKSIYFGHSGRAIACCYNRTYTLGVYPEQSIKGIWEGDQAEKLRRYISANNMDHGCQNCKSQIVAGNYDATKAKQYDENRMNDNQYPSVMEFELSNTCNLECEMCSGDFSSLIRENREGRAALKNPYDQAFVNQLEEFIPYLEEVKFYGGEPFLIDIYYDIWDLIIKINPKVRISVQTNGTILNNRVKRIMEQSNFHMNISIDSLDKDNYERIRKNAKFDRTIENVEWFRNYCKKKNTFFGISACAMQQNWHELPAFVRYCNKRDIPVYFHTVFYPKECSFPAMAYEEIQHIVEVLSKEKFPSDSLVETKNKRHFEDTLKQLKHLLREKKFETPESIVINDLDDLRLFLRKFIADQVEWSESEKRNKQRIISDKLDAMQNQLGSDYSYDLIFSRTNFNDSVFVHSLLHQLESWTPDALVLFVKNFK